MTIDSKRLFDISLSYFGLTVLSPLFILLAIAIKRESPGPIFYRGVRVGRFGKSFRIFKFRSMVADADKAGVTSTNAGDMRITRIGKIIRAFKLDEFSQLINVLIGDMSLLGPRPWVQKFVDMYTEEEKQICSLRPGITDWASIKYHNEPEIIAASGIADADEAYAKLIRPGKIELQMKYLRERNLWIDIKIIVCTIFTIISTRMRGKELKG